jgi:hypothetical protein
VAGRNGGAASQLCTFPLPPPRPPASHQAETRDGDLSAASKAAAAKTSLYEGTIAALRRDVHEANARIATADATLAGIALEWERKLAAAVETTRAEQTAAWEVRLGQAKSLGEEAVARARSEAAATAAADRAAADAERQRLESDLTAAQAAAAALDARLRSKEEEAAASAGRLSAQLDAAQAQVATLGAELRAARDRLTASAQAADAARADADAAAARLASATATLARSRNDIAAAEAQGLSQARENAKLLTVIATLEEVVGAERAARRGVERDLRLALQRAAKLSEAGNMVPLSVQAAAKRAAESGGSGGSMTGGAGTTVLPGTAAGGVATAVASAKAAGSVGPHASRLLARSFNQHLARQHARAGAGMGSTSAAVAGAWSSSLRSSPEPDAWLRGVREVESVTAAVPTPPSSGVGRATAAPAAPESHGDLLLHRVQQLRSGRAHSADPVSRRLAARNLPTPGFSITESDTGDATRAPSPPADGAAMPVAGPTPTSAAAVSPSRGVLATPSPRVGGRAATAKRQAVTAAAADAEAQLAVLRRSVQSSFAAIAVLQREKAEREERVAALTAAMERAASEAKRDKVAISRLTDAVARRHGLAKELQSDGVALWQRLLSLVRALAVALARCGEEAEVDPAILTLPESFTRPLGDHASPGSAGVTTSMARSWTSDHDAAPGWVGGDAPPAGGAPDHGIVPLARALMSPPERRQVNLDERAARSAERARATADAAGMVAVSGGAEELDHRAPVSLPPTTQPPQPDGRDDGVDAGGHADTAAHTTDSAGDGDYGY